MGTERHYFDAMAASSLMNEMRKGYATGKTKSYEWRAHQLKNMLKMCEDKESEIVAALASDLGKPAPESILYEMCLLRNSCSVILNDLKQLMKPEKVKVPLLMQPCSAEIVAEPLGVVLVISTWNYPFLLSLDPVIGAIAAGNAVVLKPSEHAPATASLIATLLKAFLDPSCVRVVEGGVDETTALLDQKWDKIFYIGSARVGRIIMASAAKHLTPVVLELGGKSPVIVDSDVDFGVTARRIVSGKWGCNSGQTCVSPDYILTTKETASKLVANLKRELERFYGNDVVNSKEMSRIVNAANFSRLEKLLDDEKVAGKIVYGGHKNKDDLRISPTILLDVPLDSLIMNEEIFGPLLPIVIVEKVEDSFEYVGAGEKPLGAYLFSNRKELKEKFVGSVSAGGIVINDVGVQMALVNLPFGGVGASGMGSYHGKFSFDAFSHKKPVAYRSFAMDTLLRYPPYTPQKVSLMKAFLLGDLWRFVRTLLGF